MKTSRKPKITEMSKQQFRQFHFVRKSHNDVWGEYELYSFKGNKYICKQFSSAPQGPTYRSNPIYFHYGPNKYFFPLMGQPLSDLTLQRRGPQLSLWLSLEKTLQQCMLSLISLCTRLYREGVVQILGECFRVQGGGLLYQWEQWMGQGGPREEMKGREGGKWFLWEVGMLVIDLMMPEVRIRNYDYEGVSVNWDNVLEKLRLWKIKASNKELIDLVHLFITFEYENQQHLERILNGVNDETKSKKQKSQKLRNSLMIPNSKKNKQNLIIPSLHKSTIYSSQKHKANSQLQNSQTHSQNPPRIRLRSSSLLTNSSTTNTSNLFSLKQFFMHPPTSCVNVLDYLNLQEHIIQSIYQSSVIYALEGVRVKSDWKHKVYPNGSIYLGDLDCMGQRHGKGIYLFDSEDLYFGDWNNNAISGHGIYIFRSGQFYQGGLKDGVRQGQGKFCYKDGRVYEGGWIQGAKGGFGAMIFPNGTRFFGFFRKGKLTPGIFTSLSNPQLPIESTLQSYSAQCNTLSNVVPPQQLNECPVNEETGTGRIEMGEWVYEGGVLGGRAQGVGRVLVAGLGEICGEWKDGIMVGYKFE